MSAINEARHNFEHRVDDRMLEALGRTRDAVEAVFASGIENPELIAKAKEVSPGPVGLLKKTLTPF